ncbi:MAG: class I SAM-dependent methyltransferase [Acidobacteriota bacterium]
MWIGERRTYFFSRGAKVTGIDISQGLLSMAKEHFPQITFATGDFRELPFADETFDGVWAHAALVHLETVGDVKKSLQEFYRVLKKHGILHVYVKEQRSKEKTAIVSDQLSQHERFFRYFTEEEMQGYLKETGFTTKEITIRHSKSRKGLSWICIFAEK